MYGRLLGQWSLEMNHVAAIVGGFNSQQKHVGQKGVRFTPVPRDRQARAVRFLNDNAFRIPAWLTNAELLRRIEAVGVLDRIKMSQQRVLASLLSTPKLLRLVEQEAIDGATAYRPADFLADVRHGVFGEIYAEGPVAIDAYRRNRRRRQRPARRRSTICPTSRSRRNRVGRITRLRRGRRQEAEGKLDAKQKAGGSDPSRPLPFTIDHVPGAKRVAVSAT